MTDQCTGLTKAGTQCRRKAAPNTDRCRSHFADGPESETLGANERAVLRTLRSLGRTEDEHAAQFQMLRSLAAAVDATPTRAALWNAYREALSDLEKDLPAGDNDLEKAKDALRSSP
jgi:hypothetical protein